jgi:hypothetical protein
MTPFSDFYQTLRLILGDNDLYSVFDYQDATLDASLRAVFLLGRGPADYALDGDRATSTDIAPDVPVGGPFELITCQAGLLLIGGEEGALNYRTRALSVSSNSDRVRRLMSELKMKVHQIQSGNGSDFESIQSFATWVRSVSDLSELALGGMPAPNINRSPVEVNL